MSAGSTPHQTTPKQHARRVNKAAAGRDGRRQNRSTPAASVSDALSDRATLMLIRRTLCPQTLADKNRDDAQPIEELLPPLTSRNDLDLQIYAFLAIILREFVQNWYNKITPDETFVDEIVQVIAHCTRALEGRFRNVDLESLIFDEIPDLLDRHVTAYRASHTPVSQAPVEINPREAYHALCPLLQLSPVPSPENKASVEEQAANETVYRQLLVEGMLSILLPTEDLENPCLTALVGQILSELIIGNLFINKASQPWLLFESVCTISRVLREKKAVTSHESKESEQSKWSLNSIIVSVIHLGATLLAWFRLFVDMLTVSATLQSRFVTVEFTKPTNNKARHAVDRPELRPVKAPVLEFKLWKCAGNIIQLSNRMPWLSGILSLIQHQAVHGPGRFASLDSRLDRFLSRGTSSLLSPSKLAPVLRTLRGVVFPNNAPGSSSLVAPESEEELLALRHRAATSLIELLPMRLAQLYFGHQRDGSSERDAGGDAKTGRQAPTRQRDVPLGAMADDMEGLLMVFGDEYCNKHLMYSVLELILVRLMPELVEKGVMELLDERLG